jgi:peptidoglycan/LPS O-acetylase OafA/YrhL
MIMILIPCILKTHSRFRKVISSHFWNVLEELTFSAYLFSALVLAWYFSSRQNNIIISIQYLACVSIASCFVSFIFAVPFYLIVERPFKNFLHLILFPNRSIFEKQKDVEDDDSDEELEEEL